VLKNSILRQIPPKLEIFSPNVCIFGRKLFSDRKTNFRRLFLEWGGGQLPPAASCYDATVSNKYDSFVALGRRISGNSAV